MTNLPRAGCFVAIACIPSDQAGAWDLYETSHLLLS